MPYRILLRRDSEANWLYNDPVLMSGEPGYETDTGKLKIGDGQTPWSALDYYAGITGPVGSPGATGSIGDTGPVGATGPAGQSTAFFDYQANTGVTSGNPGSGFISWNNASQISSGKIYVNMTTQDNVDIDIFLALLATGNVIYIQDKTISNNFQQWNISGTPVQLGISPNFYWEIPVSYSSGGYSFSNLDDIILVLVTTGPAGPIGPTGPIGNTGSTGATGNSYGIMTFSHSEINPVDATTYYFGQISSIPPGTSSKLRYQSRSLFTGQISQVGLVTEFTPGSIENSTLTIANVTQSTTSVISSSVQYYAPQTLLIFESLQTLSIPSGWSQVNVSFLTTYALFGTGTAPFSANLDTLTFNAASYLSLVVSFDTAKFGSGVDGPLRLSYSLDGGSTWTVVGNGTTPTSATYSTATLNVPVTSSTMRLRWDMTQTTTSQKRLRNVTISGVDPIDGSSSLINLSSPLSVTEGDLLEIRWQTPTWSTNPTSVANLVNLKINS